jgi:hypothetical protein
VTPARTLGDAPPGAVPAVAPGRALRTVHVLLVVAAVAYAGLPLEVITGFPLDPVTSYLSEHAARGQAWRGVFVTADALAGLAVATAGAILLGARAAALPATPDGPRRWAVVLAVALVVAGAATVVDVLSPMACAPSADAWCASAEAARELGAQHTVHEVSSSLVSLALVAACVAALALVRGARGGSLSRVVRHALAPLVVLATSAVVGTIAVASTLGADAPPVGLWQRAQTLAACATFVVLVPLLRAARVARRAVRP